MACATQTRQLHQAAGLRTFMLSEVASRLPILLREPADEGSPVAGPGASDCLSEDDVLSFAAGGLKRVQIRRIDEHLGRCGTCSRLVTDVLGEDATSPSTNEAFPLVPFVFAPSSVVDDRFAILRPLGRGGMGEVYAALDLERQQVVALKTVRASRCDSRRAMAELAHELRAGGSIEHPNVCRIHATGVHEQHGLERLCVRFIVMDYIDGVTLGQRVREHGALPPAEARSIARQILLGLEAIHSGRIIHLDVKSDNVMLHSPLGVQRAVLIDFGLARATAARGVAARRVERPIGTPSYMAPEQLRGEALGPHTDVFGLGVVLYEMLTGRQPFAGARGALDVARAARESELPLRPAAIVSHVSLDVDAFVATCTRASARDRYPDARTALTHFDQIWR
jgi:eukaryotic-like serine/threonine-protein kinase